MAMKLNFGKMPWYGQLGAFAAISLVGIGVFWNWYAKPAQDSIDQRVAQLAMVHADIDRGMATARRLPEFRKQVADLEAQLDRLRPVLPDEKDVADLLRRIQGMIMEPFDYPALDEKNIRDVTTVIEFNDPAVPHGLIMSNKSLSPEEQAKWRALVNEMRADGTVRRIFEKYFKPDLANSMVEFQAPP